jgi:serine/threonine protein kinase
MGEVYRARDTRLERTVAIKVLPGHLSSSAQGRQRFEREARALSSFSHPHICTLYDVGHENGVDFLVMEFLEGESLAARLEKGPLPTTEVLRYAVQIADALDKAHRQGVIHRDLKPGNIVLTKSGAKLLDFGLAKAATNVVAAAIAETVSLGQSAQVQPITSEGTIVGTFQYMAPEQLEGKPADARTDIFAFGAVLYEMATGRKAFSGKSQATIIAAILSSEPPPISSLQPMTPPALDRVVKTCLAKDPDERFQNAHDLKLQLQWIAEAGSQAGVPTPIAKRRRTRERLAWSLAATAILALGVFGGWTVSHFGEKPEIGQAVRFQFSLPAKVNFRSADWPVISPDGARLAFSAIAGDGTAHIWVRRLDSLSTEMFPGTEGAFSPFWSPDSKSIGFFAEGKLKRLDLSGGAPQILCDAPGGLTGAWNRDGIILFGHLLTPGGASPIANGGPLYSLSAAGGETKPATEIDQSRQETTHFSPKFLPDGRHFLYSSWNAQTAATTAYVGSLDSKEKKQIVGADSWVSYTEAGYVLYVRAGTLFAQQFDARRLDLAGDPVPVAGQVAGGLAFAAFSVSRNGVLTYRTGSGGNSELIWLDRRGNRAGMVGPPGEYSNPSLSPDGSRLAIGRMDPQAKTRDLWVFDLTRGTSSRLTFDPADDLNPVWTQDGSRIFFTSNRKGQRDIYEKSANGIGAETLVFGSKQSKSVDDLLADGRYLVYNTAPSTAPTELWILPLFGERKPFPFVQGNFNANQAQFSPNGRFVAYSSNETGRPEIYVQTFPEQHGKWQISTDGGSEPAWRHDGKELFYMSATKLMAAEVKSDVSSFEAGIPKPLFEVPFLTVLGRNRYIMTADGQRFLFNNLSQGSEGSTINVVVNWPAGLSK